MVYKGDLDIDSKYSLQQRIMFLSINSNYNRKGYPIGISKKKKKSYKYIWQKYYINRAN